MIEATTRVFDVGVPSEVQLEVRRNMRASGWDYKGTTAAEDNQGRPLRVQNFERVTDRLLEIAGAEDLDDE